MKATVTITASPFTGTRRQRVEVQVDADGTCRVYDSIAGHWTTCHALDAYEQDRAARKAGCPPMYHVHAADYGSNPAVIAEVRRVGRKRFAVRAACELAAATLMTDCPQVSRAYVTR